MRHAFTKMVAVFSVSAIALAGCVSPVPLAQNYPTTQQYIMQSAAHWQILADQTASDIKQALPKGTTTVHLVRDGRTSFSRGFDDLLASELNARGLLISNAPGAGQYTVRYRAETVAHDHEVPASPFLYTFLGALGGTGVWMSRTQLGTAAAWPIAIGTGALIDAKRAYMPSPTDTEVVITTSIASGAVDWYSRSNIFYVQSDDRYEYDPGPTTSIQAAETAGAPIFSARGL